MGTRRRLDRELVARNLVASRTEAVAAIAAGRVLVSGAFAEKASRMVAPEEPVLVAGEAPRFVSRGGLKLEHALDEFGVDPAGLICLDAGASTGGFTDCLLQRGAMRVYAVDVGRGQLARRVAEDERVVVMDSTNARNLSESDFVAAPSLVVADLSFIGLAKVAPALVSVAEGDADFVLLVKPQFEAGPELVGKGGVVRSVETHRAVLLSVAGELGELGLTLIGLTSSPIRGRAGNVEFLGLWRDAASLDGGARPAAEELVDEALAGVTA